jgi:hypothetical protein
MTPQKPSFVFGYWRPWNEKSNLFESYLDYVKDVSLVKYGADIVGGYIEDASKKQIEVMKYGFSEINTNLSFVNKKLDILIEQQKLSVTLLKDISNLLKIPDSEKERFNYITNGIKHFTNAKTNDELYDDALSNFSKALEIKNDDFFVLFYMGCIYLYVKNHINPKIAFDYFLNSAKYAEAELLSFQGPSKKNHDLKIISSTAYEKLAFCSYILGDFQNAEVFQKKGTLINRTPENLFFLAKYQVRNNNTKECINNLKSAIQLKKEIFLAIYSEIDLINENAVSILLSNLESKLDSKILSLIEEAKNLNSFKINQFIFELQNITAPNYILKSIKYDELKAYISKNEVALLKKISLLDSQINYLHESINSNLIDSYFHNKLTDRLNLLKNLSLEQKEQDLILFNDEIDTHVRINEVVKQLINEDSIVPEVIKDIKTKCNELLEKNNLLGAEKYIKEEYSKFFGFENNLNKNKSNSIINKNLSKSKKCFIATAAMGNEDHYIVNDFRIFRDTVLNHFFLGKVFINFYYLTSPPIAYVISNVSFIRNLTAKYFIKPIHSRISKYIE